MAFNELDTLYRFLAKTCHPDVGPAAEREQRDRWMKQVNAAYAARDLAGLKRIATEVLGGGNAQGSSHHQHTTRDADSERRARAEQARQRHQAEEARKREAAAARQREAESARQREAAAARQREAEARARAREAQERARIEEEARRWQEHAERLHQAARQREEAERLQRARHAARQRLAFVVIVVTLVTAGIWGAIAQSSDGAGSQPTASATRGPFGRVARGGSLSNAPTIEGEVLFVRVDTPVGMGAYLRNSASWDDKGMILAEGQQLAVLRQGISGDDTEWYFVRVLDSTVTGYIPTELTDRGEPG